MGVLAVLGLLVFGVVSKGNGVAAGRRRRRPPPSCPRSAADGDRLGRRLRGQVGARQRLGLVVWPVPGRGARARALLPRAPLRRLRDPRHRHPGRPGLGRRSSSTSSASPTPSFTTARATTPTSSRPPACPRTSSSTPTARSPSPIHGQLTPQLLRRADRAAARGRADAALRRALALVAAAALSACRRPRSRRSPRPPSPTSRTR